MSTKIKKVIETPNAPAPIGPYSQAVQFGNLLFLSGQVAINPETQAVVTSGVHDEAVQVMKNLNAVLTAAGYTMENVLKTTIFLTDMNDFATVNAVYGTYFKDHFPARETVAVKTLPKSVNVEISVIAGK
jgi:2-iminobutanoate/2-iminopropanoate deaminase